METQERDPAGASQAGAERRRFLWMAVLLTSGLLSPRRALSQAGCESSCGSLGHGSGCSRGPCAAATGSERDHRPASEGWSGQTRLEPVVLPVVRGGVIVQPQNHPPLAGERGFLPILAGGKDGLLIYLLALPDGGYAAVSPTCPHEGCIVGPIGWELFCPCHGSTFQRDGRLLIGPARRPLETFTVREQRRGSLFIDLANTTRPGTGS
jgi:Rieske Fe-S protein